jgi:hypothetical protein
MSNYWGKAPSSRAIKVQELAYSGSGTTASTNLMPATTQIRAGSDIRGYLSFGSTTATTTSRDTATVEIYANQPPEYFTARAGEVLSFTSTSSSTGSCIITEMA